MKITQIKKKYLTLIACFISATSFTTAAIEHNAYNKAIKLNTASSATVSETMHAVTNDLTFTDAELAQMLAPIALYPDTLLSHILISATYPIDIIDAERWLKENQHLSIQARADKAEDIDWDPSVKALLPFPKILEKLSTDLQWMRNIGDAFLQDEAKTLATIQTLRAQADNAGNLSQMENVNIVRQSKTIIIEPHTPDIIYVPYYDTRIVYGNWHWRHNPPIFWHRPARFVQHHNPYYWHSPVRLSIGLFFGDMHWHNRHVVVRHHKSRYYKHHSGKRVSTSYQAQRWQHKSQRRKGVAYRSSITQPRFNNRSVEMKVKKTKHRELKAKLKSRKTTKQELKKHNKQRYTKAETKRTKVKAVTHKSVKRDVINRKAAKKDNIKHQRSLKKRNNEQVKSFASKKLKNTRANKVIANRVNKTTKSRNYKTAKSINRNMHKKHH